MSSRDNAIEVMYAEQGCGNKNEIPKAAALRMVESFLGSLDNCPGGFNETMFDCFWMQYDTSGADKIPKAKCTRLIKKIMDATE